MTPKVLMLAGGGGHTGYAYALAQALEGRANLNFLVPEDDWLSMRRLSKFGKTKTIIKPRGPKTSTKYFIGRMIRAIFKSFNKVPRDFDVIISTGSNFCIPPSLIGWFKGIPIVNIESSVRFSSSSLTAKILQPFSFLTALQWEEQRNFLSSGILVGPLLSQPEIKPWNGGYILVTGGTYGHKLLFDTVCESKWDNVVIQSGRIEPEFYRKAHPEWKIITVSDKFHEILAGSEIVITHFGSTVLDAVVYGKNVVLVPNPEWTRTAGMKDAKILAQKSNAVLVSKINLKNISDAISSVRKREVPVFPDGASCLADKILNLTESQFKEEE